MTTSGRLERYETRTSGPLTVLALAFLVVFGAPIVWPGLPREQQPALMTCEAVSATPSPLPTCAQ